MSTIPIQTVQAIAAVCHEANRAYCASLGDFSQALWADAPDWQRSSAMNGVRFHLENPQADDSASHENWRQEKINNGWRFGDVKDEQNKTHPCMVPFHELPPEQQAKDRLFRSIVHALAPAEVITGRGAVQTQAIASNTGGRVMGVGRMADNPKAALVLLRDPLTDDGIRSLNDYLRNWR